MKQRSDFKNQINLLKLDKLIADIHLLKGQEFVGLSIKNILKLRDILNNLQHALSILNKYALLPNTKQEVLVEQCLSIIKFYVEFLAFWNIVPSTAEIVKLRKSLNNSLNPLGRLYVQVLTLKFLDDSVGEGESDDGES